MTRALTEDDVVEVLPILPSLSIAETRDFYRDRLGFDEFWCGEHHSSGWEMIAAPELVEAEAVEVLGEVEIALELERRVLTERVMRRQERAELDSAHTVLNSTRAAPVSCAASIVPTIEL